MVIQKVFPEERLPVETKIRSVNNVAFPKVSRSVFYLPFLMSVCCLSRTRLTTYWSAKTYVVTVLSIRDNFAPQFVSLGDALTDLDITPNLESYFAGGHTDFSV